MNRICDDKVTKLTIVIPCYNEERTLKECVEHVIAIGDEELVLELIIVDDCSTDNSHSIALNLKKQYPEIEVVRHEKNSGKGAALRTGFKLATGEFVAVQDADLEYDPNDLKRLIVPLRNDIADVVLGSRFLATGVHRVLYFWHSMGNRFLTFLSNMFTDLNLTDMETCYKVFRRSVIQTVEIEENRFGFEPEIVAKIAQMRLRIYEMGISYYGRTYEEGKKIGVKDGFRALYCILRYNAPRAPIPIQFLLYLNIGGIAAIVNFLAFVMLHHMKMPIVLSAPSAFLIAAIVNYVLCIKILFRHKARWNSTSEIIIYLLIVVAGGMLDLFITKGMVTIGFLPEMSKLVATISVFIFNFMGRRFVVFPEPTRGKWKPQNP
jgi:glycosyltransferase involved in cell wall biosynthesis